MSYVLSTRTLRSDPVTLIKAANRRAANKAAARCINHGDRPAAHGVRCWDCVATHQRHDLLPAGYRAHLAALRLVRELKEIGAA